MTYSHLYQFPTLFRESTNNKIVCSSIYKTLLVFYIINVSHILKINGHIEKSPVSLGIYILHDNIINDKNFVNHATFTHMDWSLYLQKHGHDKPSQFFQDIYKIINVSPNKNANNFNMPEYTDFGDNIHSYSMDLKNNSVNSFDMFYQLLYFNITIAQREYNSGYNKEKYFNVYFHAHTRNKDEKTKNKLFNCFVVKEDVNIKNNRMFYEVSQTAEEDKIYKETFKDFFKVLYSKSKVRLHTKNHREENGSVFGRRLGISLGLICLITLILLAIWSLLKQYRMVYRDRNAPRIVLGGFVV